MKSTKKSLFLSTISLVLCFAMLLGSTYAWFTDEVTSGVNRIVAGNLDIDLLMDKGEGYVSIAGGQGDIFKEADKAQNSNATLWEPGKTQFAKLAIVNKGNLAVKYTAYIDVTDNGLADALECAFIPLGKTAPDNISYTSWEQVKEAVHTSNVASGRNVINTGVLDEIVKGTLNETEYVLLAVHMKEEAGNEYQGKDAIIDVTIVATQKDAEKDAFGPDYDASAQGNVPNLPAAMIKNDTVTKTIVTEANTVIESAVTPGTDATKQTTVTFPKEITQFANAAANSTATMTIEATPAAAANNKFTVGNGTDGAVGAIDLEVKVNDVVVDQFRDGSDALVTVKVETYVAKNLTNVTFAYGETNWTKVDTEAAVAADKFFYDKDSGKLVFGTTHFSTFVLGANEVAYVESNNTAYLSLKDAITVAQANDTVSLLKNVSQEKMVSLTKSLTINGNKHAITSTQNTPTFSIDAANLGISIEDLTITGTGDGNSSSAVRIAAQGANLNIESCDFSKNMYLIDVKNYGNPGYNAASSTGNFDTENPFEGNKDTTALAADAICNLTIKGSKLSGYGCINWKYVGGTCQVENCTFFDGPESNWAAIIIEGNGVNVTVRNSEFKLNEELNSAIFQCGAKDCTLNLINCTASGNGVTTLDQMKTFVEEYNGGAFEEGDYYYSEKAGGVIMDNSGGFWSISTGNKLIVNGEIILQPALN